MYLALVASQSSRGELSLLYDAQMPAIIAEIFEAIHIGDFTIRISNRKVLTGFCHSIGIATDKISFCIRTIDAAEKIGEAGVRQQLEKEGLSELQVRQVIDFTQISGHVDEVIVKLKAMLQNMQLAEQLSVGIAELETVVSGVRSLGVAERQFCIDLSIARGLDYYTGTVYETTLIGHEALGSICSGGRYENLIGMFLGKKMPGVGISIGLTRLMSRLLKAEILQPLAASTAQVMVLNVQKELMSVYLDVSQQLRRAGLKVLTCFEQRALGKQLQSADKQGIPLCVIIGSQEVTAQKRGLKNLKTGEQIEVGLDQLAEEIKQRLTLLNVL